MCGKSRSRFTSRAVRRVPWLPQAVWMWPAGYWYLSRKDMLRAIIAVNPTLELIGTVVVSYGAHRGVHCWRCGCYRRVWGCVVPGAIKVAPLASRRRRRRCNPSLAQVRVSSNPRRRRRRMCTRTRYLRRVPHRRSRMARSTAETVQSLDERDACVFRRGNKRRRR